MQYIPCVALNVFGRQAIYYVCLTGRWPTIRQPYAFVTKMAELSEFDTILLQGKLSATYLNKELFYHPRSQPDFLECSTQVRFLSISYSFRKQYLRKEACFSDS